MPMVDAFIPEGALAPEAEHALLAGLGETLLRHLLISVPPEDATARELTWVMLHRPVAVYAGGAPARTPRYRIVFSVPEGQFDDAGRRALVERTTAAVLDAEQGAHPPDASRVWVITQEIPEGSWGLGGTIIGLADIAGFVFGDPEEGRRYAEQQLGPDAGRRSGAAILAVSDHDPPT